MKRIRGLVQLVIGIGLIALVISQVQFLDDYETRDRAVVRGRIVSHEGDTLRFRTTGEETPHDVSLADVRYRLRVAEEKDVLGVPEPLRLVARNGAAAGGRPLAIGPKRLSWLPEDGSAVRETARADWASGRVGIRDDAGTVHEADLARVLDLQPEIHEGLLTIGARLDWPLALGSSFLFFLISWIGVWRWKYLMATQGLPITMGESFRLTYIGFFFNNVVPGLTGGDIVKAYYIAKRRPGARAPAAVSVFVDRIVGIVGLAALGGGVLLFRLDEPAFHAAGAVIFVFLACTVVGGVAFFSRRVRRWCRIDRILEWLPGAPGRILRKIDRAFFSYREHRVALLVSFLFSILNHAGLMVMNIGFARALGIDDVPASAFFVLIPVVMMISSIPLLPGGWGIGEFAYATFLGFVDVPFTQAIALSFVFRISNLAWSLLGGLFFVTDRDRVTSAQLEREAKLEEEAMGVSEG